ncbi:MAG: pectin acetylesterase-family hydrolase [Bdellovibrionota bacterium]
MVFSFSPAFAGGGRAWKSIAIDGAFCGDGSAYHVFVSPGDPHRVAVDLMGGGACWSFDSCLGPDPHAWIHSVPRVLESGGLVSEDPEVSPVAGFTMVYFPYCTGDVHVGAHVARYGLTSVHHEGRTNVERALAQLVSAGVLDPPGVQEFVMYGASAGAIGALFHVFTMEAIFGGARLKTVLADAPGLHFGHEFWSKFTPELLHDYAAALSRVGMAIEPDNGNISGIVPAICSRLPSWHVGVLQGSRDIVMSDIFGALSQDAHERMVYGPDGVFRRTSDPGDFCSAWVPESAMHTFLVTDRSSLMKTSDGMTAREYGMRVMRDGMLPNYR